MKTVKSIFLLIVIFSLSFNSCKKDKEIAPDLPPRSSFLADFSDFTSSKMKIDTTSVNWNHASGNVIVWNLIITVGLVIPVTSYIEAVSNHEAVYQSDNTWLWEYPFGSGGNTYKAKLFGTIVTDSVNWEMYISKSGDFEDFLWYSGSSGLDRMGGNWILYNQPTIPTELLRIDWKRITEETGYIRYMNIEPNGIENGGYILYGNDADTELDSYYDIYNKGLDNLIEIEWNSTDISGRVKDSDKFGDENWHCWDIDKKDVNCPE